MHYLYANRFRQPFSYEKKNVNFNRHNQLTIEDFIKNCQSYKPQKKKIDKYIFSFQDSIGKGNFANVYKGLNTHSNEFVAIKVMEMKSITQKKLYCLLEAQMEIFKSLRHNNILKCYDVLITDNNCYVISEFCQQGDLESYLSKHNIRNDQKIQQQSGKILESIIFDIYQGLLYLQRKGIVHRDIKMSNILVKDGTAKIADFGFAFFSKSNFKDVMVGSPAYMPPQALIDNIYGPKTDVWAFGILLYQIFHIKTPFDHCKSTTQLIQNLKIPFNKQKIQEKLPQKLKNLIQKCLAIQQSKRPTFRQLWMDDYIWQLRSKFKQILKKEQKQSCKIINQNFQIHIQNQPSYTNTQKFQINQVKEQKTNNFDFQMQEFYKMAQQMNKKQLIYLNKSNQSQKIRQNSSSNSNSLQKQKNIQKNVQSETQNKKNEHSSQEQTKKSNYSIIIQKQVKFELILYFLQLYRLLNKLIVNFVNLNIDFQSYDKYPYAQEFKAVVKIFYPKKDHLKLSLNNDQVQNQSQQQEAQKEENKIYDIFQYASTILKQISSKIEENSIKYQIQSEGWLKQKKLQSLLFQYKQNLQTQLQKYKAKNNQFQLLDSISINFKEKNQKKNKIQKLKLYKFQKQPKNSSKNQVDQNQKEINLKLIIQFCFQILKKIQSPLTNYSDSQYKTKDQKQIEQNQQQNEIANLQKEKQKNQQYINKMASMGNILALIYIQSKKLLDFNKLQIQKLKNYQNQKIKIKKTSSQQCSLITNQKEIQDFLILDSKETSSLDMFFQYMYQIQLQMLHQNQNY